MTDKATKARALDYDEVLRVLALPERRKRAKELIAGARPYAAWKIFTVLAGNLNTTPSSPPQKGGEKHAGGNGSSTLSTSQKLEKAREMGLFKLVAGEKGADRLALIQDLTFSIGIDMGAIEEEIKKARGDDLEGQLDEIHSTASASTAAGSFRPGPKLWRKQAYAVWDWFEARGGKFFNDPVNKRPFLFWESEIHELVKTNIVLMGKLWHLAGFNPEDKATTWILADIRSRASHEGTRVHEHSWSFTDKVKKHVYLNLGAEDGSIIKIADGKVSVIPNGVNEDEILLRPPHFMKPFTFIEDPAGDVEALKALGDLVYRNIATTRVDALFSICWGLCSFLTGFTTLRPLAHFQGIQGSGKTEASKLMWALIYGSEDFIGRWTLAGMRSSGALAPFLIADDMSGKEMKDSLTHYLKVTATGGGSARRSSGSDDGVTFDLPSCLISITGILPFDAADFRERIFAIHVSRKHQNPEWMESAVMGGIIERRDAILSAFFRLMAIEIVPGIPEEQAGIVAWLKARFPKHSKSRMDEIFSLMVMVARRISEPMEHLPDSYEGSVEEYLFGEVTGKVYQEMGKLSVKKAEECEISKFVKNQDSMDRDFDAMSSPALSWLLAVFEHFIRIGEDKDKGEGELVYDKELTALTAVFGRETVDDELWRVVSIEASADEILSGMSALARQFGRMGSLPFPNALSLSMTINNVEELLKAEGIFVKKNSKIKKGRRRHIYGMRFEVVERSGEQGEIL